MGISITKEQMMISSHVMIRFLLEKHPGKSVYVVGTPSLLNEFRSFGIPLVEKDPDIVVLGFDTTLTYEKLSRACHSIRNSCIYYGINPDLNCPMERGTFIPDCGSMARLVELPRTVPGVFRKTFRAYIKLYDSGDGIPPG